MTALKAWLLSLPFIADLDSGDKVALNPYQWEGANGWGDRNVQSVVACAFHETEARVYAADIDCLIWLDEDYAACVPFADCHPDWKPGVVCIEWGSAQNE